MKRIILFLTLLASVFTDASAVLKEKDLEQTLDVLRTELTQYHIELTHEADAQRQQNRDILNRLMETVRQSSQNALMLYSQQQDYVFDLTYACHEATELYQQFQRQKLPFQSFISNNEAEIAKFDSLIVNLKKMPTMRLNKQAKTDRTVCLTLATNIRNTLETNNSQLSDYVRYYTMAENTLKSLNDYANDRYNDIQRGIFINAGENYFEIIKTFGHRLQRTTTTVSEKYRAKSNSQWDSRFILYLFASILIYGLIATLLNLLAFKFMPRKFHTREFLKKRPYIIIATTTITFALLLGYVHNSLLQNFLIMASGLLIEYAWLLGVILISLLLRVDSRQINSAFRIYTPLLFVGFVVISLRIILIPNELVNIAFPPLLLLCTLWQWNVITRHNRRVPKSDMIYTYLSLLIFVASLVCSWIGYTLLSVQILIWWIMQLTCILTITCLSGWIKMYGEQHHFGEKPITATWFYDLIYTAILPVLGVYSVMLSVYWAADVFNLSDLCWNIFKHSFIDLENLQLSILKLTMVITMWFAFRYIANTILAFLRLHYESDDPTSAASREVMSKNVIQVLVWGIWLLLSLSLLHISLAWLLAISGGLSTGIGFASKNIIENIFYGASLMAGRLKVGDWIEVDGTRGRVQSISYTSTIVESLYGEVITFQNSQLFDKNYKNLTKNHGYVLAVVEFGVAYGSNLKQVTDVVETAVNSLKHEWIDPEKRIKSVISGLGESSVDFKLFVWADAVKKSYVISDILKCVYNALDEAGIEIPFPQRDIHIINN